jgi:hypothetical protein
MKKSNMYDWCVPWNPLAGECPHKCVYCSTKSIPWKSVREKYSGELRLDEKAMKKNLGSGNTWFVCAQNDLFANTVPQDFIEEILHRCRIYDDNEYVFQTKNPVRYMRCGCTFPSSSLFGCTIETNHIYENDMGLTISKSPSVASRMLAMEKLESRKFITIEPILDFDVDILSDWIKRINPEFVNIGADSKRHNLPEPSADKIHALIEKLTEYGIEIREKHNLERLLPRPNQKAMRNC